MSQENILEQSVIVGVFCQGNYVLTMFTLDRLTALWLPVMYREKSKPIIAITLSLLAEAFAAGVCWPTLFLFDINGQVQESQVNSPPPPKHTHHIERTLSIADVVFVISKVE